jgi:MFS transporter, FSR family, fosmidomycin resistance protein
MEASEKKILGITISSHALTHVAEQSFPAIAIVISIFYLGEIDYAKIGIATFVSTFLFGFSAIPSGRLIDKIGPKKVLLIFLFGTGVSLMLLPLASDFVSFTLILSLVGAFAGLYHPAGMTMISLGIKKHGKAMGAHGMGGNLGLALTPFFVAGLSKAVGWKTALIITGTLPLAMGIIVLLVNISVEVQKEDLNNNENGPAPPYRFWPLFVLFTLGIFNGMTYRGLMTFLPAYFSEKAHFTWLPVNEVVLGGGLTTAVLLVGIIGQMVGGTLADKYKHEKLFTAFFILAVPVLFLLGKLENMPLVLATGVFAFFYFASQPVGNSMLPRYCNARVRGRIFGLFFFMNFGTGSVMSYMAGKIAKIYDLPVIFTMFSASLAVVCVLGFVLIRITRDIK